MIGKVFEYPEAENHFFLFKQSLLLRAMDALLIHFLFVLLQQSPSSLLLPSVVLLLCNHLGLLKVQLPTRNMIFVLRLVVGHHATQ
jgi:hypothetical protein